MSSTKIIDLEQTQELRDLKIVTDFFFEPDTTQNFILELNTVYKDVRVIFHYYKDWNRTKRKAKDALIEKEVQKPHIKAILDALDANYNTVTATQENYNQYSFDDYQHRIQNEDSGGNKEEKDSDGKKTYTINKYSQGIPLAESILINNIPYFIQISNNKPLLSEKISLSDIDIVPPERTEYISKEYSFESEDDIQYFINMAQNETLCSLFNRIRTILKKYIDLDDDFINILAGDIIFTYFQDRFGMTHYLWIVGDNNTGKSNILLIFSILCYRAVYDTSITPANIYNFCGSLEEAQGTIIEDEMDDIDFQDEKKKLYKQGHKSGGKVTRMYDNNNSSGLKNSSRQQAYFLYCFKMFASEKIPNKKLSKGFLERLIPLKSVPGGPEFDIAEVVDDSRDEESKELYQELIHTRKLLLMYRLLHHKDLIPNVKLNIKNRYKQLTKPLIRLFQSTESVKDIIKSLSKYLLEKNQEKIDSLDSALLTFIINLVSEHGETLYNEKIWQELKEQYPDGKMEDKPYSWFIEGYGSVTKQKINDIFETKFGAKKQRDKENGRGLTFNKDTLNKLSANYSIIDEIKIIKEEEPGHQKNGDKDDKDPTFRKDTDPNNGNNTTKDTSQTQQSSANNEGKTHVNNNRGLKMSEDISKNADGSSIEASSLSSLSPMEIDPVTGLTPLQRTFSKIERGLFTNPLIPESDLTRQNYDYDPEIINNITRNHGSDRWYCMFTKCKVRGDKWLLMKHPCKKM
jgi:hypothetical protein